MTLPLDVVPSSPDGLHCGPLTVGDFNTVFSRSSRPLRTGSIAAVTCRRSSPAARRVVPSSPDGLHCGGEPVAVVRREDGSSRPLRTGSIAARLLRIARSSGRPSSRPLRTGSIAAYPAARRVPPSSRSSRPLRTGSIAAACPHRNCQRSRSRPVLSGRAPLRPATPVIGLDHPPVVPSSPDGLHCGWYSRLPKFARASRSSRPLRTGSIAALRGPSVRRGWGWSSRPLRTGSIAARLTIQVPTTIPRSSRPLRTGSIAAPPRPTGPHPSRARRPVLSGRAPLRPPGAPRTSRTARVVPSSPDGLHCGPWWAILNASTYD